MVTAENTPVVEKLKKLRAQAESCKKIGNEAEAQAFADMLQRLLDKHNLEMSDVEFKEASEAPAFELRWYLRDAKGSPLDRIPEWGLRLASIIAEGNHCKVIYHSYRGRQSVHCLSFYGMEANCVVCEQTLETLYTVADSISYKAYEQEKRKMNQSSLPDWRPCFLLGFVSRLRERFAEHAAELASQFKTNSVGLMRIHASLRVAEKALAEMKLGKHKASVIVLGSSSGYQAGKRAANAVNIGGSALARGQNQLGDQR